MAATIEEMYQNLCDNLDAISSQLQDSIQGLTETALTNCSTSADYRNYDLLLKSFVSALQEIKDVVGPGTSTGGLTPEEIKVLILQCLETTQGQDLICEIVKNCPPINEPPIITSMNFIVSDCCVDGITNNV